jgi:hypothetical protein
LVREQIRQFDLERRRVVAAWRAEALAAKAKAAAETTPATG